MTLNIANATDWYTERWLRWKQWAGAARVRSSWLAQRPLRAVAPSRASV